MKQLKCYFLTGILFVLITGTLSHFLYEWTGRNFLVGLFTPVNESVWEHLKLLFFPMLLFSAIMIRNLKKTYPCIASSLCFGILAGTLFIPVFFYSYTFILGKNVFVLDLLSFLLGTVLAYFSAYKPTLSCRLSPYRLPLYCAVLLLFLCFMLFTCYPPDSGIFAVYRP